VADEKTGSDFRWEATIKPSGDPEKTRVRWYRWDKEEGRWEFYGNEGPSWDELSEGARKKLTQVYDFVLRSYYDKERHRAIERGMDPEQLPGA
jgi:hypothetical protein